MGNRFWIGAVVLVLSMKAFAEPRKSEVNVPLWAPDEPAHEIALFNFALNHAGQIQPLLKVSSAKDGAIRADLGAFFRAKQVETLQGWAQIPIAVGNIPSLLIAQQLTDPQSRDRFMGTPDKLDAFLQPLQAKSDRERDSSKRVFLGAEGGYDRIGSVVPQGNTGRVCFRIEYLMVDQASPSRRAERGAIGVHYAPDAEQWICEAPNGFLRSYFFNAKGELQSSPPVGISVIPENPLAALRAPASSGMATVAGAPAFNSAANQAFNTVIERSQKSYEAAAKKAGAYEAIELLRSWRERGTGNGREPGKSDTPGH